MLSPYCDPVNTWRLDRFTRDKEGSALDVVVGLGKSAAMGFWHERRDRLADRLEQFEILDPAH